MFALNSNDVENIKWALEIAIREFRKDLLDQDPKYDAQTQKNILEFEKLLNSFESFAWEF